MALTAALPIVSFADEHDCSCNEEDKMVVTIIHLDENGNPLEDGQADRDRRQQSSEEETERASEETTDTEDSCMLRSAEAEAESDEDECG